MRKIYIFATGFILSICLLGCAKQSGEGSSDMNAGKEAMEDLGEAKDSKAQDAAGEDEEKPKETINEDVEDDAGTGSNEKEDTKVDEKKKQPDDIDIARVEELKELEDAKQRQEQIISISFTSRLLSEAKDGSSPKKNIVIYLPPGYYTSEERYPVVYWFHGFGESPYFISTNKNRLTSAMQEEGSSEFIIVGLDGKTEGECYSYWSNSPVTGDWEGHVINEIVPFMDENFRTVAKAEARGTSGFSMGGFASINLAFKHPDMFKYVLSVGPGLLRDDELDIAFDTWKNDKPFLKAYARTFAPNPEAEALGDIPTLDGSDEDNAICEKWLDGFGHVAEKVDNYLSRKSALNKIMIIYGESDYYKWIPEGCKLIDEIMTGKNIDHTMVPLKIGHIIPNGFVEDYFIPFFSEAWAGVSQ